MNLQKVASRARRDRGDRILCLPSIIHLDHRNDIVPHKIRKLTSLPLRQMRYDRKHLLQRLRIIVYVPLVASVIHFQQCAIDKVGRELRESFVISHFSNFPTQRRKRDARGVDSVHIPPLPETKSIHRASEQLSSRLIRQGTDPAK
ncbi:hypothetical protein WI61_13185 [Burkholderia cepacia]|nr:hypothetical protein WI48_24870 [Burkholderia cepacia]KVA54674.1 hypothetical protein WI47_10425 [Burkholderia cepacia]KVA56335.1 hypothetical protein WI49_05380 [Burkholderia cepacia]KVA87304.1 hypothetical protein WI51_15990 [Burkholderia cepacia]KVA91189.1 hypothetical protein WI52_00185 [Burkholderia cepacia]